MKSISDAEWEVMRIIWTYHETTSKEIINVLGPKKGWSTSTIKTLLARLVEKELVSSYRQGKHYVYSSLISEDKAQFSELKKVFARICQKKHAGLLLQLLDETLMTSADVQIFSDKLVEKNEHTVDEVYCNCVPGQCLCMNHRKES
ncbi:CopY/TcrY family copper transport repressor [Streptococcus zalophi]|uniref:CopY/TcrY family copper transport repressor n=1 Tax=Streptococcus zalophi TaxID=640031 RepID=A0A934P8U3_9STRE|nr:CopY/TcrY family copper transport repressor [Streptococcus zalophi]MBJ8349241.1 CopY/TcrY family copper transport repressor [Streptococcus zalophi]MCR8967136.1 CopY/TcrY family copper transport repressor [Streptococcus zalophi]